MMIIILVIMMYVAHIFPSAAAGISKSDKKPSEVAQKEPSINLLDFDVDTEPEMPKEVTVPAGSVAREIVQVAPLRTLDLDSEFPAEPESPKGPTVPERPLVREIVQIDPLTTKDYPGAEKAVARQAQQEYSLADFKQYSAEVSSQADQKVRAQPRKVDMGADKAIAQAFMSFEQFMNESLYNKVFGYYTTRVKFGHLGDFSTYPLMMAPVFGGMIAYQAYAMWLSMLESGDITENEPFYIIEFGAGTGQLTHDILYNIKMNAQQEEQQKLPTLWGRFMHQAQNVIGEISPALRKQQAALNESWIKDKKLQIYSVDARDVKTLRRNISPGGKPIKGLIVTNELPDAFGVHVAHLEPDGSVKPIVVVPVIKKEVLQKILNNNQKRLLEIEKSSNNLLLLLSKKTVSVDPGELVLSQQEWITLKKFVNFNPYTEEAFDKGVSFKKVYVCPEIYPEIAPYMHRHSGYLKKLAFKLAHGTKQTGDNQIVINFAVEEFMKGLAGLLDKGFLMTIDYGDNSLIHEVQARADLARIRGYKYGVHYHPFDSPGTADITSDINFTDLAIVGNQMGLTPIFFGIQSDLSANAIHFAPGKAVVPFNLASTAFGPSLAPSLLSKFLDNSFKLLIQKKGLNQRNIYNIVAQRLPLVPPE
jgi:SAM-dependent MidA family methyltransferase